MLHYFLMEVNGLFRPTLLLSATYGDSGWHEFRATVPDEPALIGSTLGFVVFARNASGKWVESNDEVLRFQ